jgi:hypothetical protein
MTLVQHCVTAHIGAGLHPPRPFARSRNRSDPRRALRPASTGTASIKRLSLRTAFERDSNPLPAAFPRLLYPNELSNRWTLRESNPDTTRQARPLAIVCPWRHAQPRRTEFGGSAPARLVNLGSWASGTSGCRGIREERANASCGRRRKSQPLERKGKPFQRTPLTCARFSVRRAGFL